MGHGLTGPRSLILRFHVRDMESVQLRHQAAQTLVEFGLLLALVAVVCVASLLIFGGTVSSMMSTLSSTVATNV